MALEVNQHWEPNVERILRSKTGEKVKLVATLVPVDQKKLHAAQEAAEIIIGGQRRLLNHLIKTVGVPRTLETLGVPSYVGRYAQILTDPDIDVPIMRLDLIPSTDGRLMICEINVGSSVGGSEVFDILQQGGAIDAKAKGPLQLIADLAAQTCDANGLNRILVADFSKWRNYGLFSAEFAVNALKLRTGLPVETIDEVACESITNEDLVYRLFVAQDLPESPSYVDRVFENSGWIISDFSGEILGSKAWFALLSSPWHRDIVGSDVRDALENFVPKTELFGEKELEEFRVGDHEWFLKRATDFGGRGVYDLRTSGLPLDVESGVWVRQRPVDSKVYGFRRIGSNIQFNAPYVLGAFKVGPNWTGCIVRASPATTVINAGTGAYMGWSEHAES